MQLIERVAQMQLTRQEILPIWMRREGLYLSAIAMKIGMTKAGLSNLLRRERIPTRRFNQLRDIGIPEDLLPRAEDIKAGPKPRQQAAAFLA